MEKAIEIDQSYVKAWAKKGDIEFIMKEYHKALESYKTGLGIEPDNAACKSGLQKTTHKINFSSTPEEQAERQVNILDPDIFIFWQIGYRYFELLLQILGACHG